MAKAQDKKPLEEKKAYVPEPNPRTVFEEKYRKAGFHVGCTDGILMFYGPYDMQNITAMLQKDGYVGSFGVSEKEPKKFEE